MRSPFSLFKYRAKAGVVWYARYHDQKTGEVLTTRSTGIPVTGKKGRRVEAYKRAEQMLSDIREAEKSPLLIHYLESFWKDDSPYVRAKRIIEKKPLSAQYIQLNALGIKSHVKPYLPFQKLRLQDLKPGTVEDWKIWALEKGTGPRRVNAVLNCMKVAVRYSVTRGDLEVDPFRNVKKCANTPKEKGILTRAEIRNLINAEESDPRVKLGVLLAVFCGLRRGEARGLRWIDIDREKGLLNIRNNFVDGEGAKGCKAGSERQVLLPETLLPLFDSVRKVSPYTEPHDFVLFSIPLPNDPRRDRPFSRDVIRAGFRRFLKSAGISPNDQKARNLTYHGMRHTFITLARMAGLPDITVQALAGHKSAEMMNHYSHAGQVIDFEEAREKMRPVMHPNTDKAINGG